MKRHRHWSLALALSVFCTPHALAQSTPRLIDFVTHEGTEMSVDVSPDDRWITFDLLGQVYRMPVEGGVARPLTANSGIALNFHPRFSPDGHHIAFVSDRAGQLNLWVMDADGDNPRPIRTDLDARYYEPAWAPDGRSIFAVRAVATPGRGWHRRSTSIWQIPLDGSAPRALLSGTLVQHYAPSVDRSGRELYFHSAVMALRGLSILQTGHAVGRLNLRDGAVTPLGRRLVQPDDALTADDARNPLQSIGAAGLAEIKPVPSPDGRYVAFARSMGDRPSDIEGYRYCCRTVLVVRELSSGAERVVLDPITKDLTNTHANYSDAHLPGYAWLSNSRGIVIAAGGRIVRVDISTGSRRVIEFEARVHRELPARATGYLRLDPDEAVKVRFIQWPVASPNGRHLAFVALGRIWLQEVANGTPRPLARLHGTDIQLTPVWSPDGSSILFTSWNDRDRGQVWRYELASGAVKRVSTRAGEYIHPAWTPDGKSIVALSGPGPGSGWNGWDAPAGWRVVQFTGTRQIDVAPASTVLEPIQWVNGRMFLARQTNPQLANDLKLPFPSEESLRAGSWMVASVGPDRDAGRPWVVFPARVPAATNHPLLSPDGRRVAYVSDSQVFVEVLPPAAESTAPVYIDPNPNVQRPGRLRLDELGGIYPHWRDAQTLEFASGSQHVSVNVVTGERSIIHINLTFPRDRARGVIALSHARVIPMEGDRILEDATILIRDGRIECVGECSTEAADRVLDLTGKTITPGLIDIHEHIATESSGVVPSRRPASVLALAYGVTTAVDLSVHSETLFPIAEMTEAGRMLGPRMLGSAEIVLDSVGGPNGGGATEFGDTVRIRGPSDATFHVERRAAWGAAVIKNYRQSRRQQQQWLVDAARSRGLAVTAEGGSLFTNLSMTMDGQTGWEHYLPAMPIYRDVAQFMGQAGVNYSPTVSVAGFADGSVFYWRPRAHLLEDAKYRRLSSVALLGGEQQLGGRGERALDEFAFPVIAQGVADIVRAGGTATIGEHGEQPGIGSHWEMWSYAQAMSPMEVLRMATLSGARFIGLEHEIGSVSVGKRADLAIFNTDILQDIRQSTDMAYVVKSGRVYEADSLTQVWPDIAPLLPVPWAKSSSAQ